MNSLKCSVSSGECCSIVLFHSVYRPALGAESVIYITSISSVVGAWLGAVPIPLDWDRPWQVQDQFCAFMCVCVTTYQIVFHCNFAAPLCHVCAGVASELCGCVSVCMFVSHNSYWILFHCSFAAPLCADVASKL